MLLCGHFARPQLFTHVAFLQIKGTLMSIEQHTLRARRRSKERRCGLTFLEFLGCFSATTGGVVIGSLYLGVDVVGTTKNLFQKAQATIASGNPGQPLPAAAASLAPSPQMSPTPAAAAASTAPLLAAAVELPSQPAALATPTMQAPALTNVASLTDEQRAALTDACWKSLSECMAAELDQRAAGIKASGNGQLYNYLAARSDGHRKAAEAIAELTRNGVDPHVTTYADMAQKWHEEGARLYSRAKDLLTDAPTAQLSGPFAKNWQSAATQHQMEERLLAEKHQAVKAYLEHFQIAGSLRVP
jgi:hypothetical protein